MLPETSFSFLFSISRREINDVCFSLIVFLALQQFHSLPRCYVFVFFFPVACTSCTAPCLSSLQLPGTSQFLFVPPAALLPPPLPLLLLPRILWRIRTQPGAALMCEGRMMSRCNGHNSMFRRGRSGAWVQLRPLDLQDGALILKVQKPQSDLHTRAGRIHLYMDSIDNKANISSWDQHFSGKLLQTRRWNPRFIFCDVVALFFWIFHKPLYVVKGEIFLYFLISLNYWFL